MGPDDPASATREPAPFGSWEQVFVLSPLPMALLSGEIFSFVNPAFCELLRLEADQIVGHHFTDVLVDGFGTEVNGTPIPEPPVRHGRIHLEGPVTLPDGTERYLAVDAEVVAHDGGGLPTTIVQIADLDELNRARLEVARSERWVRSLLSNIADNVNVLDAEFNAMFSSGTGALSALGAADSWKETPLSLIHPQDLPVVLQQWEDLMAHPGETREMQLRVLNGDGEWRHVDASAVNLLDDPDVGGVVTTARDITDLRNAELLASSQAHVLELIATGAQLREVFEACVELVDANGIGGSTALYLLDEGRLEKWAGRAPAAIVEHLRDPARPEAGSLSDVAMRTRAMAWVTDVEVDPVAPDVADLAERSSVRSGWSVPIIGIASGEPVGSLCTVFDEPHAPTEHDRRVAEVATSLVAVALDRARTEERLAHLALHDPLTDLPNRTLLLDRLEQALARRRRTGEGVAVLFCDLDRFKVVNDSLGHGVGDGLLRAFAGRVTDAVRSGDTVARFGGDEFVVLLDPVKDPEEPGRIAERIARTLDEPFLVDDREVYLTVSIGMASASDDTTGDAWLRDADAAMYRAKELGRDRVEAFGSEMRSAALARLQIENDLRRAVERDELVVYFQPTVDLDTGRICGAEALARWAHPRHGLIAPNDFIPVAEDIGIISAIDGRVLELALAEAPRLAERCKGHDFELSVNVSGRHLMTALDDRVRTACQHHEWDCTQLVLEITETALSLDVDGPLATMGRISDLGVKIAIDDFGTGYSSLTRLGQLPVDKVKIDRAFVRGIELQDERLVRIVDAVVAIADALGLSVAAEGVETAAQVEHLRGVGCHHAQGFLFARPLPAEDLLALLDTDPRW